MNRLNDRIKRDRIIFLTDFGNNNPVKARRLPYDNDDTRIVNNNDPDITNYPIPGVGINPNFNSGHKKQSQSKGLMRSASDPSNIDTDNIGIYIATSENQHKQLQYGDPLPQDPEPHDLEHLENTGATIIKSETYFPASRQTVTTRSMTPEERRAEKERERQYYLDR